MILLKVWVTGLTILQGIAAADGETIVLPSVYGTIHDFDMSGEKDGVADAITEDVAAQMIKCVFARRPWDYQVQLVGIDYAYL